jgi:hypothetical protein
MGGFDWSTAKLVSAPSSSSSNNSQTSETTPSSQDDNSFDWSTAKLTSSPQQQEQQEDEKLLQPYQAPPTTSIDTVPITARTASGLMNTPQGKADVINKISPNMNAQVTQDGQVTVNGKPFNLNPGNIGAFMYDLPGMIGEATAKNIPLIANLATTVGTEGMSIPAQIALQAAGTGTAEGIKELMAQGLAQEKPNIGNIVANAAMGGAGPIADKAFMLTGAGMKAAANRLSSMAGPAHDIGPEILNTTAGIKLGVGDKVFEKLDKGEDLSGIITPENASATKPSEILNNTFFGSATAERSPINFVNTLKSIISQSDSDKVDAIKKMYQDVWGLTPQTIDTIIKNPIESVINQGMFSPNAALTVGSQFSQKLQEADKLLSREFGRTLNSTIEGLNSQGKNVPQVNIGSALDEMFKAGATPDVNPNGVGIFEGHGINQGYTGEAAKKVYGILLNKLSQGGLSTPEEGQKILDMLRKRGGLTSPVSQTFKNGVPVEPKGIVQRMTEGGHFKTLSPQAAYKFIAEIKPLLDKTFESGGLSGTEKGPLAGFMKNIRGQLGDISPEMKAMNEKYQTYLSARSFFGDGKAGNLQEMLDTSNKMSQAYANPGIRTFLGKLDTTLGSHDLTDMVDNLGASQEMKSFFDKATGKSEDKLNSFANNVKGLGDKTVTHAQQNMVMSGYDSLLPQGKKFLDPMWNHLIASEFQNKPLSVFKAKYIGMMAMASMGLGHAGVLPALGLGLGLANPRNISKGLMALQKMKGLSSKVGVKSAGIASRTGQVINRVGVHAIGNNILKQLVQSPNKQQEAKGKR